MEGRNVLNTDSSLIETQLEPSRYLNQLNSKIVKGTKAVVADSRIHIDFQESGYGWDTHEN